MALNVAIKQGISEDDYLLGELSSEIKHELIDGVAYAMAGASKNHERIIINVFSQLLPLLQNSSCEAYSSNVKVKVGENFFYPDAMVVCEDRSENPYYTESPTVLVEVLSSSTRRMDQTIKRLAYQSIPCLQELILIEQDFVDVEVCRRSNDWLSRHYFLGDEFMLESVGLTLSVADIYRRVQNPDMLAYLQQQELS